MKLALSSVSSDSSESSDSSIPMPPFLFDFDGVLVDSERHWSRADREFFPLLCPGYDTSDARAMMGLGLESGFRYLVERHGAFLSFEEYKRRVDAEVGDIYAARATLLPGVLPLLERLDSLQSPLGIASSSKRCWVEQALRRLKILNRFAAIATGDDVGSRTKPHPDLYLLAAERLGVNARRCVALEDSDNGIIAAKAAGMICIAIRTDMNEGQSLSGADRLITSFEELDMETLQRMGSTDTGDSRDAIYRVSTMQENPLPPA